MAYSFEIAGGRCKDAVFFGRYLPRKLPHCFPSLRVNPRTQRRSPITAAALAFQPSLAPVMDSRLTPSRPDSLALFPGRSRDERRHHVTPQKLDEWMHESVTEIVRNIGEAPFLVQVYSEEDQMNGETESRLRPTSSPPRLTLEREAASVERWTGMKKRWEQESCCVPDGIILVEELCNEEGEEKGAANGGDDDEGRCGKRWGVVIQGRGMDCSACYILDTCRVRSSFGFCTHFCLVRAQCYGESVGEQFKKAWLLQES